MATTVLSVDEMGFTSTRSRKMTDCHWKMDYKHPERLSYCPDPTEPFVPYTEGSQFTEDQHFVHIHLLYCHKVSVEELDAEAVKLETIILQPSRALNEESSNKNEQEKGRASRTKQRKGWKHSILIDVSDYSFNFIHSVMHVLVYFFVRFSITTVRRALDELPATLCQHRAYHKGDNIESPIQAAATTVQKEECEETCS
jgi:hypothetical protein